MPLSDHAVPGTGAAFSFQFERALYWLAKSPAGFLIGIETADDVAIKGSDGTISLEQDKHSLQQAAVPFGDRSHDLWNTLATWLAALDACEVFPNTTKFLMVTNKTLPDCIARRIGLAESDADVSTCIAALEAESANPPPRLATLMLGVLRSESRENLRSLIRNCELSDASDDSYGQTLRNQTIAHLAIPADSIPHANSIADELQGWLLRTALTAWRGQKPAWIQRDEFINQFHAILNTRQRRLRRERAENLIPTSPDQISGERSSLYVSQVCLVSDDDSVVTTAIQDFLRCSIEKMRLSAEGCITDDDWRDFEATLQSRWKRIYDRTKRMNEGQPEEDVGFQILSETTDHREKLAGSETEQLYLTAGTYHRLANLIRLGWHPRYEELIKKPGGHP